MDNLMVLHIHKEMTDRIDLLEVGNQFTEWKESRSQVFGKFVKSDIVQKNRMLSKGTQT